MAIQQQLTTWTTQRLLNLHHDKELNLSPNYQHPAMWTQARKQVALYLFFHYEITLMPGQEIILRELVVGEDYYTPKSYEVVNGKELLITIAEFVFDQSLTIGSEDFYQKSPATCASEAQGRLLFENKPMYGLSFAELPAQVQDWFLSLSFHIWILNCTDQEVQAQFSLLNQ